MTTGSLLHLEIYCRKLL